MKAIRGLVLLLLVSCLITPSYISAQESMSVTISAATPTGAPETGLTKTDFKVQDSGKERTITSFVGPHPHAAAPAKLPPNEFSNIPDVRDTSGAVFVVLDTVHTLYIDEGETRAQILKFLANAAQAKRAVTLAILSEKGFRLYHDYRSGSDVLMAALIKAGLGGTKGATPPAGVNEAAVTAEAERLTAFSKGEGSNASPRERMQMIVDLPMRMFQEVGLAAAGLPGRKMLVWVTNDVPFDIDPKTKQFKSPVESSHGVSVGGATVGGTKDALSTAEVKNIMPIWRRGVRALFDGGVSVYPVEVRGSSAAGAASLSIDTMKTLAQLTGGKAFYGSNDPFPDMLSIAATNTAGYTLGVGNDASTGTDFHPIDVSVSHPNIQLNQSAGYFPHEGNPKSRAGQEVGLAMSSPLEFTGVLFRITVAGMEEGSGGKKKVNLTITLPGDSGILNEAAGSVNVGFLAEATNASGQKVGTMNEGAEGKFPPDAVAHIKELGFQLKRSFEVPPGECSVRFLVRDNQTGRTGDLIFPLTVK